LSWNPNKIAKDNGIVILAEETAKPAPKVRMNVDSNGVILKGYDPVAYFTRHQAVKGNPAIQTRFGGAIYYFVSVADKVAFRKNPSRYVPQYGGFCAYHVSKGELKDSNPAAFLIYKGKLSVCSAADVNGKLENKVAVVTGGSAGIGFGAAKRFADEGARVFITGHRQSELDNAVAAIEGNVTAIQGDVEPRSH
jgi:YHS domain-containing protein